MKSPRREEILEVLCSTTDLLTFLSAMFDTKKEHAFSFASFARKAGYSARSFPREICLGTRKLTPKSLPSFQMGLGLTGDAAQYFRWMVILDNPNFLPVCYSKEQIESKLNRLRMRLLKRAEKQRQLVDSQLYHLADYPYVLALMGTEEHGSTLEEITRRTRLPAEVCRKVVESMTHHGLARTDGMRFFPEQSHLVCLEQKRPGAFQSFYLQTLKQTEIRARRAFNSEEHLFLNSIFTVPKKKMPRLKKELRKVLVKFVEKRQNLRAEHYCTLVCGLIPQEL